MNNCPRCNRPLNGSMYCLHCHALVEEPASENTKTESEDRAFSAVEAAKRKMRIMAIVSGSLALLSVLPPCIWPKDFPVIISIPVFIAALFIFRFGFLSLLRKYKQMRASYNEFGDFETICARVLDKAAYEDEYLAVNGEYVVSKVDHQTVIRTDEVTRIYPYKRKVNMATVERALVLVDRNGAKKMFPYAVKDDALISEAINAIKPFCPDADVGYSVLS